ncbi:GntR family transcriptional regulator [Brucella pseudogrignonensis]|uniref:GntR family transcriptional regulator n=1 Tax=Brucella pseudogrignonensis TaxID=419475 RepID=UPI003ECCFE1F
MHQPNPLPEASSLTEAVFEALRADILACRLRPGTKLKIVGISKQLMVSAGAVREALARLAAEGLVLAEAQRGFQVTPVSADELADLTSTRIQIETIALRQSIERGGIAWETDLVAAFHRLSRTPEREVSDPYRLSAAWADSHKQFHHQLLAGCGSEWLLRLRAMLYTQSERYRQLAAPLGPASRDVLAEHRAILDAALARDGNRAVAMLAEHYNNTAHVIMSAPEVGAQRKVFSRKRGRIIRDVAPSAD